MINLDANVVVNLLDKDINSEILERSISEHVITLTPLTIHIVWYFFDKGRINCSKEDMLTLFASAKKLFMSDKAYDKALIISKEEDIEDGMQVVCCLENQVDKMYTADVGMYAKYSKIMNIELI